MRFIWRQHGKWQHLVPAVLYQTLYYSLELFWKLCMQVINVLLKRKMLFNWHVHSSFWPTVYMFKNLLLNNLNIHFSHISSCVGSWYVLPKESCEILHISVLKCEIHVGPSPQAEMHGDCGDLYIMLFCLLPYFWHTVHCLKEINDYGKPMPFGYFLTTITSLSLILFIFHFYLHKERKRSLPCYHWDDLSKLERQI